MDVAPVVAVNFYSRRQVAGLSNNDSNNAPAFFCCFSLMPNLEKRKPKFIRKKTVVPPLMTYFWAKSEAFNRFYNDKKVEISGKYRIYNRKNESCEAKYVLCRFCGF